VQLSDPREAVDWFASYLETYVQRDVRSLSHLQDLSAFSRFTSLIAARTGCILNFSELGKDIGVNYKTAQHYSSIFEAGYLWRLLAPYHGNNVEKRLSKSPKGVMLDSGLAAFLMGFYSPDGIDKSPLFSQLFETLVISEFAKLFAGLNERVTLMHFRAGQTHEVDLILQHGQRLIPIEIKASGSPRADWGKGISVFRKTFGLPESCTGYVVSFGAKVEHLRENVWNLPLPLFY
jgi:predicted AAA+ superfamily ATPase